MGRPMKRQPNKSAKRPPEPMQAFVTPHRGRRQPHRRHRNFGNPVAQHGAGRLRLDARPRARQRPQDRTARSSAARDAINFRQRSDR